MQLSEAIDGWLAAHSTGLSRSTRRDILDIGASADRCGYAWMDCVDVRERHTNEIVSDADAHSSLNAGAIRQFLEIAVEWGLTQDAPPLVNDLLPSDTDGWLDAKTSPVVNDLDLDDVSWADELPPVDDLDVDNDGVLDPVDDDQFFDVDDINVVDDIEQDEEASAEDATPESETAEGSSEEDADEEDSADDEDGVDEDDFDDDELAAIDDDLATTDEDDLDPEELDDIDGDLDALIDELDRDDSDAEHPDDDDDDLFEADDDLFDDLADDDLDDEGADVVPISTGGSAFSTAAAAGKPADPAASSFLRTLEQTGQTPAVFGGLASQAQPDAEVVSLDPIAAEVPSIDTAQSGIFSEAAQYEGERSVDWITVAYFAVAAICFALVIYFYLSS